MEDAINDSGETYQDIIEKFRVELVQSLDLDRQFIFSYLRSKRILDDEDCELILNTGASRQQKVSKFLDMLMLKGADGFGHFIDALEYEHPQIFEKISGKKASVTRMLHSPMPQPQNSWDFNTGLAGKELVDFDRQYLAKQLERVTMDFQALTYVHSKNVKEKSVLEQKLQESTRDLELLEQANTDLKYETRLLGEQVSEVKRQSHEGAEPVNRYIQDLSRENMERSNMVIALQSRLLASGEELDKTKKTLSELRSKNENLMQQVKELVINYDTERRQSKRLTDKVRRQTDQMKQVDQYKKENYELKYKLAEVTHERDDAVHQLDEFRKVTEALNVKYDLLKQEKDMALEYQNRFHGQYLSLEQQALLFEGKVRETTAQSDEWKRKYERSKEELITVKEQRDSLLTERESAIAERSSAIKERDELRRRCEDLKEEKTEVINKQIAINRKLESQYETVLAELEEAREKLRTLKSTSMCTNQNSSLMRSENTHADSDTLQPGSWDDGTASDVDDEKQQEESDGHIVINPSPFRRRSNLEVLQSAYLKLKQDDDSPPVVKRPVKESMGDSKGIIKGLMSNEQFEMVFSSSLKEKSSSAQNLQSLISSSRHSPTLERKPARHTVGVPGKRAGRTPSPDNIGSRPNIFIPPRSTSDKTKVTFEISETSRVSALFPTSPFSSPDTPNAMFEVGEASHTSTTFITRSPISSPVNFKVETEKKDYSQGNSESPTSGSPITVETRRQKKNSISEDGHVILHRTNATKVSRGSKGKADTFSAFIPVVTQVAMGLALPQTENGSSFQAISSKLQSNNSDEIVSSPDSPVHCTGALCESSQPSMGRNVTGTKTSPVDTELSGSQSVGLCTNTQRSQSPSSLSVPLMADSDLSQQNGHRHKNALSSHSMRTNIDQSSRSQFLRQRSKSWTVTGKADV